MQTLSPTVHTSVLSDEVLGFLSPQKGDVILDATLGGAGHSETLLSRGVTVIGFDADEEAIERARVRLARFGGHIVFVHANFRNLERELAERGISSLSHALFDLGLSSDQLEHSGRGFSFMRNEPLHMTFGEPVLGFDARTLLNSWSEEGIADALWGYGEERYAKRIARAIIERREKKSFETTGDLIEVVRESVPSGYRRGRTHYATKTFQALRIAVNDELRSIEIGLAAALSLLRPQGRLAVISFHSIEDRTVKNTFKNMAKNGLVSLITKKPVSPSRAEQIRNPRARSAKLRVVEKQAAVSSV